MSTLQNQNRSKLLIESLNSYLIYKKALKKRSQIALNNSKKIYQNKVIKILKMQKTLINTEDQLLNKMSSILSKQVYFETIKQIKNFGIIMNFGSN